MQNAIRMERATKAYSQFTLKDVSFTLPMGYIMGLIGPNGSGKTTTIQLLLNMLQRDGGDVQLFDQDLLAHEKELKQRVGVVFDQSIFVEDWAVRDVEAALSGFYHQWDSGRYRAFLDRFAISESKKIKELSRGMQMKLMLAFALSRNAELLILDEPTSGLDPLARSELMDILLEYIEDGRHSVLFSTHITTDLERVADFITFLLRGELVFTGSKDDFLDRYRMVRGSAERLTGNAQVMGARKGNAGSEGLILTKDAAGFRDCLVEQATIDEIMIFLSRGVMQ